MAGTVLAVAVGGGTASAAPPAPDRSPAGVLQRGLDDLHGLGITGVQGQVRDGDRVSRARSGVADLRTGAPMPLDGYFRMGSDTKTFVSVVVLQLVGEGRIGLDDPVARWLPGVITGNGNDGRRITVRQVLQHTSGIYNYTNDLPVLASAEGYRAHRFDHYTEADLVALAMRHPPEFAPGTHWSYSNTNYVVAGMLIQRITGRPWPVEVRSRILVPLGMRQTFFPGDRPTLPRPHAEGYQQFAPGGPLVDTTVVDATVADAAGGLASTTADLTRFWQALQRGQLLRPRQMAQLHGTVLAETFQDVLPGLRYGLGIMWVPNRCGGFWAHPGDVPGTSTLNGVTPDGHRAVVFYETTELADPVQAPAVLRRGFQLLDDLICG
ncbi:MAG: serine hydrolase [Actinobacteria bacterium 13_2_20CM_2_72_6]|nr:MAG: serine hydrolase [Actinobacteria bacterium 13_2_20CM_2_72_6]